MKRQCDEGVERTDIFPSFTYDSMSSSVVGVFDTSFLSIKIFSNPEGLCDPDTTVLCQLPASAGFISNVIQDDCAVGLLDKTVVFFERSRYSDDTGAGIPSSWVLRRQTAPFPRKLTTIHLIRQLNPSTSILALISDSVGVVYQRFPHETNLEEEARLATATSIYDDANSEAVSVNERGILFGHLTSVLALGSISIVHSEEDMEQSASEKSDVVLASCDKDGRTRVALLSRPYEIESYGLHRYHPISALVMYPDAMSEKVVVDDNPCVLFRNVFYATGDLHGGILMHAASSGEILYQERGHPAVLAEPLSAADEGTTKSSVPSKAEYLGETENPITSLAYLYSYSTQKGLIASIRKAEDGYRIEIREAAYSLQRHQPTVHVLSISSLAEASCVQTKNFDPLVPIAIVPIKNRDCFIVMFVLHPCENDQQDTHRQHQCTSLADILRIACIEVVPAQDEAAMFHLRWARVSTHSNEHLVQVFKNRNDIRIPTFTNPQIHACSFATHGCSNARSKLHETVHEKVKK